MNFKLIILAITTGSILFSCKQKAVKKEEVEKEINSSVFKEDNTYPDSLVEVFKAHGGLAQWKEFKTLEYSIVKKEVEEQHTISLDTRKDIIKTTNYSIGFDGEKIWKLDPLEKFKGDPMFYHNLYFYFYAMPFVLADDGIIYGETPSLIHNGVDYPGVKISYDTGVGVSYKDNYFIHYHPETNRMEWLGYTVTYRSGEVSDKVKWIRYNDWELISGVQLPKSITWCTTEDGKLVETKKKVTFNKVDLRKSANPKGYYAKPNDAIFVSKK